MSRDTSFYYSFLVLPPRKRRAIIAIWDFCRAVDDAVDEMAAFDDVRVPGGRPAEVSWGTSVPEEARRRGTQQLAVWHAELDRCYATRDAAAGGDTPRTRQGRALQPFVREFRLPRQPFEDLLAGVAMDLEQARYPTFETLLEYCRRVASAVGLICLEVFGYRDPRARSYAINLGIALQLTNIIRDVAVDVRHGRVYLPTEDLVRFDVGEDELAGGRITPAVRELLRFECARAREYYRRAAADLPPGDARRLVAAEIMGGIYFAILRRIERAGYDVFRRRIRVPRPYRAAIALRIWTRTLMGVRH